MTAPERYIHWINEHLGFNPRSQAGSNALSDYVVADLRAGCAILDRAFEREELVARKNVSVATMVVERNIDLVIGGPGDQPAHIAVEHKTIMAAHGKARKNRYGDIIAYSNHVHNHQRDCIAGAILVINSSPAYENPDGFAKDVERPQLDMAHIVRSTIAIFAGIPLRETLRDPADQPEALAVIVIDYDGIRPSTLVRDDRAPQPGETIHYGNFVSRICELYERRHRKP